MPSPTPVDGRCNAKLRHDRGYCTQYPVTGRDRCKMHGGKAPRGTDSPHWKGRGYSKDLPTRYADRMRSLEDDAELIRLGSEMRLLDARVGELMQELPSGEAGLAWDRAQTAFNFLKHAILAGDQDKIDRQLDELDKAMTDAQAVRDVWSEVYNALELRRKLADTERKRIELHESTMTAREAQTFFAALQVAILEEVTDPAARTKLARRIELLLASNRS